jgi:hypothetical protein
MFVIRAVGLLVVLAGLYLVGVSGDNHRIPNGRHLAYGASLMALGALVAMFADDVGLQMGWTHP